MCAWCDCLYIGMQHSTHECRQQVMVHVTFSCQLPLYVFDYDQSCRWIMSEKHREYRIQRDRARQRERLCVCTCSTHTKCWVSVMMLCCFPSFFSLSLSVSPSLSVMKAIFDIAVADARARQRHTSPSLIHRAGYRQHIGVYQSTHAFARSLSHKHASTGPLSPMMPPLVPHQLPVLPPGEPPAALLPPPALLRSSVPNAEADCPPPA